MESSKSGNQEQSKVPMIIVIKGPSSSKKSEIANKLAKYLQYPLIDEEGIIPILQNSLPISSTNTSTIFSNYDYLPFKIRSQISSTQLQLKLGVIIKTSVSQHTHFDQLLELASTKESRLVIIKCTGTEIDDQAYDYEVGHNVPNFNINMAKPFVVEDFVPIIMDATEFQEKVDFQVPQVEEQKTIDLNYEITAEVAQEIMTPKIGSVNIGGLIPTESMLQEANAIRRHMIIKAIGSGYIGHTED